MKLDMQMGINIVDWKYENENEFKVNVWNKKKMKWRAAATTKCE